MTKKSEQKFEYLKNKKKTFQMKEKAFFIILKRMSVARNCLKPESISLNTKYITNKFYLMSFSINYKKQKKT